MEGVTDSILGSKKSDVKLEIEENVETCLKSEETLPKIEEQHEQIIIEAEPLAWKPPADHVHGQVLHPLLMPFYVDGKVFELPEGWIVERRPRTSQKYLGKVKKFYYEPGTNRQFRSWKAAQKHMKEMEGKQNDQQPPFLRPENDRELSRPQLENDNDETSGQKLEHKPVTLEFGDESEPETRRRFRRLKDVHKYLRARKGQQINQQHKQTPIVVHGEQQSKVIIEAEPLASVPAADRVHRQVQHQHPLLMPSYVDGKIFELPEGWIVERRPRTSPKYLEKVDKFYYEPGTRRQFRTLKAAKKHVKEIEGKQNDHKPLRLRPENNHNQDRELSRPQTENDYNQESGQKHEHKPVTLELGDDYEPGARSRFQRLKDVHEYLRARKWKQNNQQAPQSQPENNHEQVQETHENS